MNEQDAGFVRADAPIERRSDDRLLRVPLAEAIADQVIHGPTGHGLVIGVAGRWGSGKTSVLKMVEETVRESSDTAILTFNPWLFSGTDQLVARFLDELAAQLREQSGKEGANPALRQAAERLSGYAESLEPLAWIPLVGPWVSRFVGAGRLVKALRKQREEQPSIEDQRSRVSNELSRLAQRVLVIIDDLDRIDPPQIRDMVRLIKLVGDFPNVTYLLSYDRAPVERSLGDTREEGAAYLEKIVQVVHDLPEPPVEAVLKILFDELQLTVDTIATGPFYPEDWQNVYPAGIRPFFTTLRDVRRYLNAIPVTLRVIGGEVALADVLALEVIRVFLPGAYEELCGSIEALTGERQGSTFGAGDTARDDADSVRVRAILDAAGQARGPIEEILLRLFPGIGHLVGGSRIVDGASLSRQRLRVGHPDILRTYVRRALPPGVISGGVVLEAVASLGDPERLSAVLEGLDGEECERLIQRLEDFQDDYDPAAVPTALPVLINQLPRLREGQQGMFDFGSRVVVARVVLRLLRSIDAEEERLRVIELVLPKVETLSGRMLLIDSAGHRENVGHRLVGQAASDRLYEELRAQVMTASPEQLAVERELVRLFVRVLEDAENGPVWVREICRDDRVFLQLLRAGLSEEKSQNMGDYAMRTSPALPWGLFQEWLGDDELRRRVEEVTSTTNLVALPDRTGVALETADSYVRGVLPNGDLD